jgi:hypothetical protein
MLSKKLHFITLIILFVASGCATIQKESDQPKLLPEQVPVVVEERNQKSVKDNLVKTEELLAREESSSVSSEEEGVEVIPTGYLFLKSDFQGVLEKRYVKLLINDLLDDENEIGMIIGDKNISSTFAWSSSPVQPGYLFLELPEGEYRISKIGIPVGSTLAEEDLNIYFTIEADVLTYLGTLRVVGTKERIKLGGVPVIRPGFEFNLTIIDEVNEAKEVYQTRFSDLEAPFVKNLMTLKIPQVE